MIFTAADWVVFVFVAVVFNQLQPGYKKYVCNNLKKLHLLCMSCPVPFSFEAIDLFRQSGHPKSF